MNVLKITVNKNKTTSQLYNEDLVLIDSEEFEDIPSLNFYIQTYKKKYKIEKILFVIHNIFDCSLKMTISTDENSLFI